MKIALISAVLAVLIAGGAWLVLKPHAPAPTVGGLLQNSNTNVVGGVVITQQATGLKGATTTPCAIQSPAATTTLLAFNARIDTASTSATRWDMAKATSPNATTTTLGTAALAIGANGTSLLSATTTAPNGILAPNTWLVLGERDGFTVGDTAGTGSVPVGTCSAVFLGTQF